MRVVPRRFGSLMWTPLTPTVEFGVGWRAASRSSHGRIGHHARSRNQSGYGTVGRRDGPRRKHVRQLRVSDRPSLSLSRAHRTCCPSSRPALRVPFVCCSIVWSCLFAFRVIRQFRALSTVADIIFRHVLSHTHIHIHPYPYYNRE